MNRISVKRLSIWMLAWLMAAALLIVVSTTSGAALAAEVARPTSTHSGSGVDTCATNTTAKGTGAYYNLQNPEEAAQILRELMLSQTQTATLRFYIEIPFEQAYEEQFWEAFTALEAEMHQMAVAHTGNPKGGDYIYHGTSPYRWWEATVWGGSMTEIEIHYTFEYLTTPEQEAAADAALDALLAQWNLDGASDYEKICTVYDWFCENVTYDYDGVADDRHISHSAYAALVKNHCVCQGYSSALYRVLLTLGVDNRVLYGLSDGESHSWNLIRLDDRYYLADATWDASWMQAGLEYEWFLKGEPNFPTHDIAQEMLTDEFRAAYPISQEDYVYDGKTLASGACGQNLTWELMKDGTLTISGTGQMDDYSFVEDIYPPWHAMRDSVKRITIEDGVSSIGDAAFFECSNVTQITIAESVTEIGKSAFHTCSGLTELTIPDSVTEIGKEAFDYCTQLRAVTLPTGLTKISESMFRNSGLTDITIPANVTVIEQSAFYNCDGLTAVTIPEGVTDIDPNAFYHCSALTSVTLPESLTNIADQAFQECTSLKSITIPKNVEKIGTSAFKECTALTEVTFCEGVEVIGDWAFTQCPGLTNLTIPRSVTAVNAYAFHDCKGLQAVRFLGDAPQFEYWTFMGDALTVYYPAGASGWEEATKLAHGGRVLWLPEETERAAFLGTSVSLGDSLDIHFFLSDYAKEDTDYVVITRSYADGRPDHVVTVPYSQWLALNNGQQYITYHNVSAKEMNDTVSLVICDKAGNIISETYTDSVQAYAMRMLDATQKDTLKTVLVDMLNYGTEAQYYFGYDTAHFANRELTPQQQSYATGEVVLNSTEASSHEKVGTALSLKSNICLDIFFSTNVIGSNYAQHYALIRYNDHYGNQVERRIEGKDFVADSEDRIYVQITGLSAADYNQPVVCTIYDAQGNSLAWVTDSIASYIFRMQEQLPEIVMAVARFGRSSFTYFYKERYPV